ncbi:hypothetical protein [Pararhodonellum marinum]|uniref:hypothetical protein n=1 Tax=Pararhodonellum marinum TaxID=2755358 RepID=UPI00188EF25A|nr:hypothetical protein [Pararhodonellum marinum]
MAYNRSHARQICNAAELEMFNASLTENVRKLDEKTLKSNIKRTREMRNKNQDLLRRQSLQIAADTGNKRGNSLNANNRTEQKVKLLQEVLDRFEKQLDKA